LDGPDKSPSVIQTHTGIFADIRDLAGKRLVILNAQSRYFAVHHRDRADYQIFIKNGRIIGYYAILGRDEFHHRDTLFEWYIDTPEAEVECWELCLADPGIKYIQYQTNDILYTKWADLVPAEPKPQAILFQYDLIAQLRLVDGIYRTRKTDDLIFNHISEPIGDRVIEYQSRIVATGGWLSHYNPPFVDLYMEVDPRYRRQGFGSFLIQELIRETISLGLLPAARCNPDNIASQKTLIKGGMKVVGLLLEKEVKT
jgi:GNAT superfamily N-acetyltransferase